MDCLVILNRRPPFGSRNPGAGFDLALDPAVAASESSCITQLYHVCFSEMQTVGRKNEDDKMLTPQTRTACYLS